MARPGQIDHIVQGISALPEKGRGETLVRYITVYLNAFNEEEESQQQLAEAFLLWSRGTPTFSFVYDTIGTYLDQPRPDGFSDEQYRFILLARTRSRRSSNTLGNVLAVAEFLARGFPFIVQPVVPRAYAIFFFGLELTSQDRQLYRNILLDTIGSVDQLELGFVPLGTALYDSLTQTYDVGVYG